LRHRHRHRHHTKSRGPPALEDEDKLSDKGQEGAGFIFWSDLDFRPETPASGLYFALELPKAMTTEGKKKAAGRIPEVEKFVICYL
jgi:hypothetical protein